ncbi:hypothetical protein L1987_33519 [Smallanthus sonchifolius]|uniref:Uncharacterized protein n=1 Tax=Smallanthus sonchifolius TaxID=185202 RepID=A0ACB9HQL3_9ASTR|nr:hypothetical protein L1987_33519 [Smallanthus sonchifolius]
MRVLNTHPFSQESLNFPWKSARYRSGRRLSHLLGVRKAGLSLKCPITALKETGHCLQSSNNEGLPSICFNCRSDLARGRIEMPPLFIQFVGIFCSILKENSIKSKEFEEEVALVD